MQYVYATHLPLPPLVVTGTPEDLRDAALEVLSSWATGRLDITVSDWSTGASESAHARAAWVTMSEDAGDLVRINAIHADAQGPWNWLITVWVGLEDGAVWVRVRVGIEPKREGVIVDPYVSVGAPRFVADLVEQFDILVDGITPGSWVTVERSGVRDYVDSLLDPQRRLPIIALTRATDGSLPIDPDSVARRTAGVARVAVVEPDATYQVSDAVGPLLSAFRGAVRLYWPGFRQGAPGHRHPFWMPGRGPSGAALHDEVVGRVGRASGLVFPQPKLEIVLRRAKARRAADEAREQQAAQQRWQEALATQSDGGLTAAELAEFSLELDEAISRRADLEERVVELEMELEEERDVRERQQEEWRQAWQAPGQEDGGPSLSPTVEADEPNTVRQAVEIASSTCPDLVFTQTALESAEDSQFGHPAEVLTDLILLQEVAAAWAKGALKGDFRNAFDGRHANFRSGISQTAKSQFGSDYAITYEGRTVMMGPHLCRGGVGAASTILRIYWFKDDDHRKLVVGHVGRKLRDESNPK